MIDLRHNYPVLCNQTIALHNSMRSQLNVHDISMLELPAWTGHAGDCEALAQWLGLPASQVVLCSGGNHALTVTALALQLSGKSVVTDEFTYGAFLSIANFCGIRLLPCPGDSHGMLPDELESLCCSGKVAGIFVQPTIHNPTCVTIPADRRYEIAQIVVRNGLLVIEDDAYRFLHESPPRTLADLVPQNVVGIHSLSKIFSPMLKVSCVQVPSQWKPMFESHIRLTSSGASRLLTSLAVGLIRDGTLDKLIHDKQIEAMKRQVGVREALDGLEWSSHPTAFHGWIHLPVGRHADDVRESLSKRGVDVSSGTEFAAPGVDGSHHLRFSTGAENSPERLASALRLLGSAARGDAVLSSRL